MPGLLQSNLQDLIQEVEFSKIKRCEWCPLKEYERSLNFILFGRTTKKLCTKM